MGRGVTLLTQVVISAAIVGSIATQVLIIPAIWFDLAAAPLALRVAFVALLVLGIVCLQVCAVCTLILLTRVRRGSVFRPSSFRYVDAIAWSVFAAALVSAAVAALLAPGGIAPGVVALIGGVALVLGGVALIVVVMKALLRQATQQEVDLGVLRAELDEVV